MSEKYADIIIDISQSNVDRPFRYRIPEELLESIAVGSVVKVPFGKGDRIRTGYVIGLADEPNYDIDKIKNIQEVSKGAISIESKLIRLAAWMKERYGCTMISALMTVMPVKEKVRERKTEIDIKDSIPEFQPVEALEPQQEKVVNDFINDISQVDISKTPEWDKTTYLLHGVTGSGKTEVYIKMAEEVLSRGQDVIVLVPEIALTYQTVARFSSYFQDNISILNSQLSKGEKYREFMKALSGETHIMIGPRSALFAPFQNLGLIIIDEEHDTAYKSEKTPKYHAREVAIKRAELEGAKVILGTATPSIESYYKAKQGEYKLYSLLTRVKGSILPEVEIVDMREELRAGNRSIISQSLYNKLSTAFSRGEQAMVFINRRGYKTFVSCRDCGEVIKCPNCDVSLSEHKAMRPGGEGYLMCHYCGHTEPVPNVCPKCKSKLIGGLGIGTETVEETIRNLFPDIKTLRMDRDTTTKKGSHGAIIKKFREGKADCLIGTQMIVKGHDFPKVTVVGNILADLSLFDTDFESAERTFDLLTQAAGRAGRDELAGQVVIQTYQPEHYAISSAASQDYESFYEFEVSYRELLHYPPMYHLLGICVSSADENLCIDMSEKVAGSIKSLREAQKREASGAKLDVVGPTEAYIYRINNVFRRVIYIKSEEYDILTKAANLADSVFSELQQNLELRKDSIEIQYDFNPMHIM
ncbi:MAG: primosomal protein N' [Eubacterium sp.]|nr:primosomal protein N' [Eubacterium sp.]